MKLLWTALLACASCFGARNLDVFFIDVEGGGATLVVGPSGDSLLIDAGWAGREGRDLLRIQAAMKAAHIKKLDGVLVTHFHDDHVGGVPALADKVPVAAFYDHGETVESTRSRRLMYEEYVKLSAGKRKILKPGDKIPLKGLDITVYTSAGVAISGGGSANPFCANAPRKEDEASENPQSVGVVVEFGQFRLVHLGDLTWNKELDLACPNNRIGTASVYLSTHHGTETSGAPALVNALAPRVTVMGNGARKGGSPEAFATIRALKQNEDLWQLHYSVNNSKETNSPDTLIANVDEACQGKHLRLTASADGSFTIWNERNKYSKTYPAR